MIMVVIVVVIFSWTILSKEERCNEVNRICEAPTHNKRPEHSTGNYMPYSIDAEQDWSIIP